MPRRLFIQPKRPAGVMPRVSAAVVLLVLLGALQPLACSWDDRYECGGKLTTCHDESERPACEIAPACEWRAGCVRACAHDQNAPGPCFPECRAADNSLPNSPEACALLEGCSWDPACFENPKLTCDSDLDEAECRRRSCKWEQVSPGTTL
jgi:hypothetical protein